MYKGVCALDGCENVFYSDNPRKKHCCQAHSTLSRVRRYKAKHRKNRGGDGGGGGNGGGGGIATLFDTVKPVNPRDAFVPVPVIGPGRRRARKPSTSVHAKARGANNAA